MAPPTPKKRGIWKNSRTHGGSTNDENLVDKVADFSYESDALAQLIVETWLGQHNNLITPSPLANPADYTARAAAAKATLAAFGVYLEKPFVLTESEYESGFSLADAKLADGTDLANGVVLVVPDPRRATTSVGYPPAGQPLALLETAKMLMAVTPNGI
jgi:hypothetical protein